MLVFLAVLLMFATQAEAAAYLCEDPPPAVTNLDLPRYYTDDKSSIVDPELLSKSATATQALTAYVSHVVKDSDAAWTANETEISDAHASCALTWLSAWARNDALLGEMASKQAYYRRTWDTTGLALAYLKVSRKAGEGDRKVIEDWLTRLALAGGTPFETAGVKRNNHWYWLGLSYAAVSTATGDHALWERARTIMQDAVTSIDDNGMLPMELLRGQRALHYHAFAVTPLVTMAELAAAKGDNWYALHDGALHRLVATTVRGLLSPQIFADKVGIPQEAPVRAGGGWLQLYRDRFPNKISLPLPDVRQTYRWLGGDVRNLSHALHQTN